ncbi:F-box associated interaction domain-containing protein [Artemisia annua]|uniref:F-box associated interaction domain-containing protein n=1 Tax=Artemisia annua TaxID=35608 RepID=A0A2U1KFI9_ARTAN|nr:F-box associated interaction domain-containing protein [Artemisia annua]
MTLKIMSRHSFPADIIREILLNLPVESLLRCFRIVGSCNGLVCIFALDFNLFIYNPSTRTTHILPSSKQGAEAGCGFVFCGFGYDETSDDYKVVKIWRSDRNSSYLGAMIYSLKAGSWKEIAVYWLACDCWRSWHIVSLDLGKETYGEVLQPEYDEGSKRLTLGVYGVKDSWTKLACIPHPTYLMDAYLDILCILKDGKVLLQFGSRLLVYDSKDSSSPEILNFDKIDDACVVVEILVSPFPPLALADNNEN